MERREGGSGRSFPIPFFAIVLLVILATILLVDDLRLRREAGEREAKAPVEEIVPPEIEEPAPVEETVPPPDVEPEPIGNILSFIPDYEIPSLRKAGLSDPAQDLGADLLTRTDLIPFESDHGLKWIMYRVIILPERHAFLHFEDGHYGGHLFLRFRVEDGVIDWTVLHAALL